MANVRTLRSFLCILLVLVPVLLPATTWMSRRSIVQRQMKNAAVVIATYRMKHGVFPPVHPNTDQLVVEPLMQGSNGEDALFFEDYYTKRREVARPFHCERWFRYVCIIASVAVVSGLLHAKEFRQCIRQQKSLTRPMASFAAGTVVLGFLPISWLELTQDMAPPWDYITVENSDWTLPRHSFHFVQIDDESFVVQSLGPDGDLDATAEAIRSAQADRQRNWVYDPTNGSVSSGDFFCYYSIPKDAE